MDIEITDEQLERAMNSSHQLPSGETKKVKVDNSTTNGNTTDDVEDDIEFIGEDDYKELDKVIWLTLAGKAFPTRMVNPFIIMKLAKAQNDQDEQKAMAYTYDLLMAMVPKRYRKQLEDHLTESEYDEKELESAMEQTMQAWATNRNDTPLVNQNVTPGPSTQHTEFGISKVVSFDKGTVTQRPLTEEEQTLLDNLGKKKAVND